MKIQVNDVEINTGAIERYEWERSHYIDGTKSTLVISMVDGTVHRVGVAWKHTRLSASSRKENKPWLSLCPS